MPSGNNRMGSGCLVLVSVCVGLFLAVSLAAIVLAMAFLGMDFERGPGVAVLNVYGELVDEQYVLEQLKELVDNPDTKALVVRVNSPGGDITVVEEIFNGLKRAQEKDGLPVVASMGATAASGGYYVCCAAQRVFANKSSLTGSLGVIVEYPNAEALLDKLGIAFETIKSGEYKDTGSLSKPLTEPQREHMQQVIEDYHEMFVELVSTERSLDMDTVRALADGRVFTGRQSIELGLADELGDLNDAVQYAARLAGIEGEPRVIRVDEKPLSWWSLLDQLGIATSRLRRHGWAPKYVLR